MSTHSNPTKRRKGSMGLKCTQSPLTMPKVPLEPFIPQIGLTSLTTENLKIFKLLLILEWYCRNLVILIKEVLLSMQYAIKFIVIEGFGYIKLTGFKLYSILKSLI
jgi:hypothetical protein